jgi:hypothetical protein
MEGEETGNQTSVFSAHLPVFLQPLRQLLRNTEACENAKTSAKHYSTKQWFSTLVYIQIRQLVQKILMTKLQEK